jgi:hypothetical protein
VLADDDLLYPDHFARLAQAAVASNADIIHGNRVVRLVHRRDDGREETLANRVTHFGSLDPVAVLWRCDISQQAIIVRRKRYIETGMMLERWPTTGDYELVIRLSQLTDFVHVDFVTAEMVVRDDRSSAGLRNAESNTRELAEMLASFCPPGRPAIEARQRVTVDEQAHHHAQAATFFAAFMNLTQPVVEEI